ncbi:MAG: anthranilate synthase component I family protein [Bacteroidota bacterium]
MKHRFPFPPAVVIEKALRFGQNYVNCFMTTNNGTPVPEGGFRNLLAFGNSYAENKTGSPGVSGPIIQADQVFSYLKKLRKNAEGLICGYIGYDVKNEVENLDSNNPTYIEFPAYRFFVPEYVIEFFGSEIEITGPVPHFVIDQIYNQPLDAKLGLLYASIAEPDAGISKDEYMQNVETIRAHIAAGRVYEMNYCLQFKAKVTGFEPLSAWLKMNRDAAAPFSAFYKFGGKYILSTSPERFLKKTGTTLLSQPIKGTAPRSNSPARDEEIKANLLNSEKERAENMMIVDLVRNDLAKSAVTGSTHVSEMFGIYSFKYVHQMISSVKARLKRSVPYTAAIANAFPPGSMTGAPKIAAMELIEELESFKRGPYSGTLGYIDHNTDFDFNVLIRSVFYDAESEKLSFCAGGAITWDSEPEAEYEEIMLKTMGIRQALGLA